MAPGGHRGVSDTGSIVLERSQVREVLQAVGVVDDDICLT